MNLAVQQRFDTVKKLVTSSLTKGIDEEQASYYAKLGCVLVCGTIERSVEIIISDRLNKKCPPQISSFLKSYFKRGVNFDTDEIKNLLFKFDNDWGRDFEKFISSNDNIKHGVDSCYGARNSIAHGGGQSLGPAVLKRYFDAAYTLVDELQKIVAK